MKNLVKLSVAGALALGGSMAAHATVPVPTSSGALGDVVLWADVFNGTTLVQAYVGDTGITVANAGAGTVTTGTPFTNANLNTLLATYASNSAYTIVWALQGGDGQAGPAPYFVSSNNPTNSVKTAPFGVQSGVTLKSWGTGISSEITNSVNPLVGTGASALSTSDAAVGGTGFNPNSTSADVSNWYGNFTGGISTTGLGTSATFYRVTATSQTAATTSVSSLFNVALTSTGLVFSALSGPPVPIPAALWLLGSGLLGLAGVARRKAIAPVAAA